MIYIPQCHTRTCQTEVRELPARYGYGAALRVVSCQVKHFILGLYYVSMIMSNNGSTGVLVFVRVVSR
jgi:hypothetical protein